jgi:heptosyltransferase II
MPSAANAPRKPLIVRLRNYVGDVVLSVPALEALEAHGYELHVFGKRWAKDLLAGYPWAVYPLPAAFWDRVRVMRSKAHELKQLDSSFAHRVNALTFVTAFSSALDMKAAGLNAAGYNTEGRGFLLSKRARLDDAAHAIDAYWDAAKILCPQMKRAPQAAELRIHPRHESEARDRKVAAGVTGTYVVLVPYPGGVINGENKGWAHFRELVSHLQTAGLQIVMAPSDSEIAFTLSEFPEALSIEKISLGAYAVLLRDAALTIANDTGPGHMAASVGGKLLSILGPTPQSLWAVRGPQVTIMQGSPGWPQTGDVIRAMNDLVRSGQAR